MESAGGGAMLRRMRFARASLEQLHMVIAASSWECLRIDGVQLKTPANEVMKCWRQHRRKETWHARPPTMTTHGHRCANLG